MPRRGLSIPVPAVAGGAMLNLLRLPREPVSACANSRVIPCAGDPYACLSDALFSISDAAPAFRWPTGPF